MTKMKPYMTDKRKYERPAMRVVELQHRTMLLQTSSEGLRGRDPYDPTDDNPFG